MSRRLSPSAQIALTSLLSAALIALLCVVAAAPALAGAPRHWSRVTEEGGSDVEEVSLARTADGTLHVVWTRRSPSASGTEDLMQTPISPAGVAGTPVALAEGWSALENPAALATGTDGLDVFVGAIRSTEPSETIGNLAFFSSPNGGASWSLFPADIAQTGSAYASAVTAALGADGTPFVAWGGSYCLCLHRGTTATTPNFDFQEGLGEFGYEPGIAVDQGSGEIMLAWYSNGTGHSGVYAAQVDASTGARVGTPTRMPGTTKLTDGPLGGRTQIAARAGGGLYVAYPGGYPSHNEVLLWHVGSPSSTVLGSSGNGVRSVGVASAPGGRLWVYWTAKSKKGRLTVYARRSNPKATTWGATVAVKPPSRASTSWNLTGNGQASRLDLLGSFSIGSSSAASTWHTQVLPGLTLKASRKSLKASSKHRTKVLFRVLDAGAPVKGALVKVGHAHARTNAKGAAKLRLGPFRHRTKLQVKARRKGYVPGSLRLAVR